MNEILFSFIVPVYGVEKYIDKCINSILSQTYDRFELILVDDGSKDKSPEICDMYAKKDKRVKVIHKQNGGSTSARNAGAIVASGDYIVCVDSDDWINPSYLMSFYKAILKYNPDMVCCGFIQSDEIAEFEKPINLHSGYYHDVKKNKLINPIAIEDCNGKAFPPQLWAKAIKRELFLSEQLLVDDKIVIGEDGAVIKPIVVNSQSIYIVDKCLYYYRVNFTSLTKSGKSYNWNGPSLIYKHLIKQIDTKAEDYLQQIYRRTAQEIYTVVYSQFNKNEKYVQIKKNIVHYLSVYGYFDILKKARFKSLKCKFEIYLIRYRFLFFIYLMNRIRR